jgi:hypothetical protein
MDPTPLALTVCILLCLQQIPAVSAFPSATFSSVYHFPGVSVAEGNRRVHSPEHLLNATAFGRRVSPYFALDTVSQPQRRGEYATLSMACRVDGVAHTVYMIGHGGGVGGSTYMCVRNGTQRVMIRLRVSPLPYTAPGHCLTVSCTYFSGVRACDRDMEPILRFMRFFRGHSRPANEHANLQWYRRMVLGHSP